MKKKNFQSVLNTSINNDNSIVKSQFFDVNNAMRSAQDSLGFIDNVIKINPKTIDNWEYRDRQEFEIGDIDKLATSIKNKGQAQPILIVKTSNIFIPEKNKDSKYVVIAGYRRWLACLKHNIDIQCIIKNISLLNALSLLEAENEKQNVSDFSKGIFYTKIIEKENISKKDLQERLGLQPAYFSNALSFAAIPQELIEEVNDWSNVSARTGAELRSYCNKDKNKYLPILIKHKEKIKSGIGAVRLASLLERELKTPKKPISKLSIKFSEDGASIRYPSNFNQSKKESFEKYIKDFFENL